MIISTNKVSSYEHFQEVLGAAGTVTVTSKQVNNGNSSGSSEVQVIGIELVNYGTGQAFFNTGSHGGAATASDRVLLVGERLFVPVSSTVVNLFSTAGTSVEVNFLR